MTRSDESEETDFQTKLQDSLFTGCFFGEGAEDFEIEAWEREPPNEWRWIVSNQLWDGETDCLDGPAGSKFQDGQLVVRRIIGDDTFCNYWYDLAHWLGSISADNGLIGYSFDSYRTVNDIELVYVKGGEAKIVEVKNRETLNRLIAEISQALL
jgi:hypothetical protein